MFILKEQLFRLRDGPTMQKAALAGGFEQKRRIAPTL
jgi:hypothetical protein